jgi:hypothetical protein
MVIGAGWELNDKMRVFGAISIKTSADLAATTKSQLQLAAIRSREFNFV